MRLYLASTSPARLATLRAAGIEPIPSPRSRRGGRGRRPRARSRPPEFVLLLARLKAEAVAATLADVLGAFDGLVLGGDSAFEFDGVVYGKPHLPEVARERWHAQRGRDGHPALRPLADRRARRPGRRGGRRQRGARVRFADDITDDEIDAYIATGEPLEVAGAFTIDARGAAFIESVEGDPHAVVGLSVPLVRTLVRGLASSGPSSGTV